jgi:hypothetical protein
MLHLFERSVIAQFLMLTLTRAAAIRGLLVNWQAEQGDNVFIQTMEICACVNQQ